MKKKVCLIILLLSISLFLITCTSNNLKDIESHIDILPPKVLSVSPDVNSESVGLSPKIIVHFSKPIDPESINGLTFRLRKSEMSENSGIKASTSCSGNVASLYPQDLLIPGIVYVSTVTTGVKDTSGNSMISDYIWSFTTHRQFDSIPPVIVSVFPPEAATNVNLDINPTITFSEVIFQRTINSTSIKMKIPGLTVGSTVDIDISCKGNTVTLDPKYDLAANIIYQITATSSITDTSGNKMRSDYSWKFTTVPRMPF